MKLFRVSISVPLLAGLALSSPLLGQALSLRLGSTHVVGDYHFTTEDYLNEGARRMLAMGTGVIGVWMLDPADSYRRNSTWPTSFANLREMADHPYFRALFNKPYRVFILTAYSQFNSNEHYFRNGVSDTDYQRESDEFYELTRYLMTTYQGSSKTFVYQHWEGDWAVRGSFDSSPAADPSEAALAGMARWINARQDGVNRARLEMTGSDVKVYNACESNLCTLAMQGRPSVIRDVWPQTRCDLYAHSAYDVIAQAANDTNPNLTSSRQVFRAALDFMASKAPDSAVFGSRNVYIGEFGWPEVDYGATKAMRVIRMTTEEAIAWGCPYLVYWQLYDNECSTSNNPTVSQCRGWWLIKPDNTYSTAYDYFKGLLAPPAPPVTGTVSGTVTNQLGTPLDVAAVYVTNADSRVTKSNGAYGLTLPVGTHTLRAYKPNYGPVIIPGVTINQGQNLVRNITLTLLPPDPVLTFTATAGNGSITLSWQNPPNSHFTGTMVRFKTDGFPMEPTDGTLVVDLPASPSSKSSYTHTGLSNAQTYYYAAFTYNAGVVRTYSGVATTSATPAGRGDLDRDGDVDQSDFGLFQACLTGPAVPQPDPACAFARLDEDNDVDLNDFVLFEACMSGPGIFSQPNCGN